MTTATVYTFDPAFADQAVNTVTDCNGKTGWEVELPVLVTGYFTFNNGNFTRIYIPGNAPADCCGEFCVPSSKVTA